MLEYEQDYVAELATALAPRGLEPRSHADGQIEGWRSKESFMPPAGEKFFLDTPLS
jgi:hypothetical protein